MYKQWTVEYNVTSLGHLYQRTDGKYLRKGCQRFVKDLIYKRKYFGMENLEI